jgi:hypothetical protein
MPSGKVGQQHAKDEDKTNGNEETLFLPGVHAAGGWNDYERISHD